MALRAASRAVVRLVVLPLDIPPGDTLSSAVGEGVRANLLRLFSRVPAIQVATRDASQGGSGDSAAQHAGAALPVRQLEGSIQRSGKRVRVTFRLVSADQSVTSWSEMYERNVADVFATQDEIARLVADTISAQLVAHKDSVRKAGP